MVNKSLLLGRMAEKGFSQRKLADRLGISKNSLCDKLNGKSRFDTQMVFDICKILGIESNDDKVLIFLSKPSQNRDEVSGK